MSVQTLNIALPQELVKAIDRQAKREYKNRSELIREAVRIYLKDMRDWNYIFEIGERAAKKIGIKSEADIDRLVYEVRHGKKN